MPAIETERVLVVPTELFHRLGYFQGFSTEVDRYFQELLNPAHASYRPRGEMEEDPQFKQLIPYVIFCHTNDQGEQQVFSYTRGSGQGEKRLHARQSVGIGGHICVDDIESEGGPNPYHEGMQRELAEEVFIETKFRDECVGLINDDETEVGKVHLGVVHLFHVESTAVRAREEDICEGEFRNVETLLEDLDSFESWSQICLKALFGSQ